MLFKNVYILLFYTVYVECLASLGLPNTAECNAILSDKLKNLRLSSSKCLKLFGINQDPNLRFQQHINVITAKENRFLTFPKYLLPTNGSKKESNHFTFTVTTVAF